MIQADDDCMCNLETSIIPKDLDAIAALEKSKRKEAQKQKIDVMKTSIYDKKTIPITTTIATQTLREKQIEKPKALVSKCENIQPFKLEDLEVEKVLVEYKRKDKKIKKIDMCNAFKLAGFGQDWTKEKVKEMSMTPDGRILLEKVNSELQRITGLDFISEDDIKRCYINY